MKLWYMRPCKPSDNASLFRDWQPFCIDGSQELDYLVAIFKLTATANAGTFAGAPISENVHNTSSTCTQSLVLLSKSETIFIYAG